MQYSHWKLSGFLEVNIIGSIMWLISQQTFYFLIFLFVDANSLVEST